MWRPRLSLQEFIEATREAVESLPPPFQQWLENVAVDVEDEPSEHDLSSIDGEEEFDPDEEELFGLFIGTPITEQHFNEHTWNRIKIFRLPIERSCDSREEIVKQIRDTVLHELAHHFGYSEEDLDEFESTR